MATLRLTACLLILPACLLSTMGGADVPPKPPHYAEAVLQVEGMI